MASRPPKPNLPDVVRMKVRGALRPPRVILGSADDSSDELSDCEEECGLSRSSSAAGASSDSLPPPRTPSPASPTTPTTPLRAPAGEPMEEPPVWVTIGTLLGYGILILFGYFRESLRRLGLLRDAAAMELERQRDFVPLFSAFESIYTRNLYMRVRDAWNRPICSVPGPTLKLKERVTNDYCWNFRFTGREICAANFGSYNYLGFAEAAGPCADAAKAAVRRHGIASCSNRQEPGCASQVGSLEALVAEFLGTEAAAVFPMGFATNSMNIPAVVGRGCLVLSDELNHASLITGCKLAAGCVKRIFRHNDMGDLERKLREAVVQGQPRTRRPFRKILVIVEGIYSMEGTIANLPVVIALKNKYKAYLWLDEAHSVGALGPRGRGAVDYWGVSPADVDVLMGTFSKSFGAAGGYVAGSRRVVDALRTTSHAGVYGAALSPPVAAQIRAAMTIIKDEAEGLSRIRRLARNSAYFRRRLRSCGFVILGAADSPVIPLMLYTASGCSRFSRELLVRFGVAVVVVGFPATPLTLGRARFCVSAKHTKAMLDQAVAAIDELGDEMFLKHSRRPRPTLIEY